MENVQATTARIDAFKSAMLNTCLRDAKKLGKYTGLTLLTCKEDKEFCTGAYRYLGGSPFIPPIETAMSVAIGELRNELWMLITAK
jgi:hypothetical protein